MPMRTVEGVAAVNRIASDAVAADAREIEEPLAKGDLLPSPFLDVAVPKTVVGTVKITPTEPPQRS